MKKLLGLVLVSSLACCFTLEVSYPEEPGDEDAGPEPMFAAAGESSGDGAGDTVPLSGYMLGSPLALSSNASERITLHWPGFAPGEPPPTPPPGGQKPDLAGFLNHAFGPTYAAMSPLLAMSMGLEVIVVYDEPRLDPADLVDDKRFDAYKGVSFALMEAGSHGWVALEFTVNEAELTTADDLAPDIEAWKSKGLDAAVFSFLLPGSAAEMLPNEFESVCGLDPYALGLDPETDRIDAIDMHAALFWTDLGLYDAVFTTRSLDGSVCLYFTLRPGFLDPNTVPAMQAKWPGLPIDSATIYQCVWKGGAWQKVEVYRTANDLRLPDPAAGVTLAIDGLAIDAATPGTLGNDEILLSLAADNVASEADQIQYTRVSAAGDPTRPPRRLIARRGTSGYGSLGKMMRAGKACGDFCQQDPTLSSKQMGAEHALDSGFVLDDFAIARRLRPTGPYVPPAHSLAFPWPGASRPRGPCAAREALAVASYRHLRGRNLDQVPVMRTCMSWPRPTDSDGTAWVRYGEISNLAKYLVNPAAVPIEWHLSRPIPYHGRPLAHDLRLPTNGLLQVPPGSDKFRAYAAQWYLRVGNRLYTSPLSVLRY